MNRVVSPAVVYMSWIIFRYLQFMFLLVTSMKELGLCSLVEILTYVLFVFEKMYQTHTFI
jgi:hypothetical protein